MNQPGLTGEFCRVLTRDRLELQGLLVVPERATGTVALHVHGLDGNFYENRFFDHLARVYAGRGIGFLTFNNRGHDYITDLVSEPVGEPPGYVQVGGMYERLADCVPDIRAWLEFLRGRGFRRLVLQGHSHGAIKATHYLVSQRPADAAALVLLSPSDDFGMARQRLGEGFGPKVALAEELTAGGRGRELMPPDSFPYPTSAATFLDTLGPNSLAGMFNLSRTDREEFGELNSVQVPVFMAVGTVEEAFVGPPAEYVARVRAELKRAPSFAGRVIEGAPHNYLGQEVRLAQELDRWLATVGPVGDGR